MYLLERGFAFHEQPATDLVCGGFHRSPPILRDCSSSNTQSASHNEPDNSLRSTSITSTLSPPGSPPPTYENAVSVGLFSYNMQARPASTNRAASVGLEPPHKTTPQSPCTETWAYMSTVQDSEVAELAGDTVVLSGTNPAGPVNPYELCASPSTITHQNTKCSPSTTAHQNTKDSRRPYAGLAELMGDLHFSTEPTKNNPGSSSDYPPRSWPASDQIDSSQNSHYGLRSGTMSETAPVIPRRPIPANAFSDSLLTVHEPPPLSAPYTTMRSMPKVRPESSSSLLHVSASERPSSNTSRRSYQDSRASTPAPNRQSVESTSSWSIGTQPKETRTPSGLDPVKQTRMQSQKRRMDLLNSIGT